MFHTGKYLLSAAAGAFGLLLAAPAAIAEAPQPITAYVTSYGYNDNDDGAGHYGTDVIAYPGLHQHATEDLGTFDHPTTFATDPREFTPGTKIYVPHLRKYFVMEDGCVECTADWNNRKYHVDLWMGPSALQPEPALDDCEAAITGNFQIIPTPAPDLPVDTTPMFSDGRCTVHLY